MRWFPIKIGMRLHCTDVYLFLHIECKYSPMQYVLKISPKRNGILVVLMNSHITNGTLWLSIASFMISHPL